MRSSHLDFIRDHFDRAPDLPAGARFYRRELAHYYRLLIPETASILEVGCGGGDLLAELPNRHVTGIDLSETQLKRAWAKVPHGTFHQMSGEELNLPGSQFDVIILSETLNFAADVQTILERLHGVARPDTRLIVNFHSSLWRPFFAVADQVGLRNRPPVSNWLTVEDLLNLCLLSDWQAITVQPRIIAPVPLLGLERLANRWLAPLLPFLGVTVFLVARPVRSQGPSKSHSVSIVIPARNEQGNIAPAVERLPAFGSDQEIIFVEGHSKDDTWAEIERVAAARPDKQIKLLRQSGKGKGNAVRDAFQIATGDILMILDADLTMPPEELPKFYQALASGKAEFVNGIRLVYPMEEKAMQFANLIANKAFGIIFSYLLGQSVKDTLCGTKVLFRSQYEKIAANRHYFGDFDPFGDFDLLFGAGKLGLKIVDLPIRYRQRTYGTTNIQRWRHGVLLLRMVLFAARKIKFV